MAVGAAATVATSQLAGLVETMQGGNGVGTTFGNTMNNFIQTLQRRGDILSGSAEEIWQLKESLEQEGMTAEDKAKATQQLIDKLGEMGVTSDQAEQAFSQLNQKGLITDEHALRYCPIPLKHWMIKQQIWLAVLTLVNSLLMICMTPFFHNCKHS